MKIWAGVMAAVVGVGVAAGQGAGALPGGKPAKRPMTFADLMAMKRVSDPQVSPSGKWVMFSVTDVSLEENSKVNHLWVVPLGGLGEAKTEADSSAALRNDNQKGQARAGAGTAATAAATTAATATAKTEATATATAEATAAATATATATAKTTTEVLRFAQNDGRGRAEEGQERQITFGEGEENGRFSPDGKWVSMSMRGQIYKAPWDETEGTVGRTVQVTNVESGGDGAVWSPDSGRLLFVAQVYPECSVKGGEKEKEGALERYEVPRKKKHGPKLEDATWEEENQCDQAKDQAGAGDPAKAEIWTSLLYRHWNAFTGAKRTHVMVVDADGKNVRDLTPKSVVGDAETPTFSLGGPLGYAWAPDSHEIAYVTNLDLVPAASTNNDVFTLRLDEAGAKAVKVSTSQGSDDGPQYSPDGRWLAFRSQARAGYESDRFRLMVWDREKKKAKEAIRDFPGWVDEYIWAGANPALYFTSGYQGEERIYISAIDGKPILERKGGEFGSIALVPSKGGQIVTLVATKMTAAMPTEIVTVALQDSGRRGMDETGKIVHDAFGIEDENDGTERRVTSVNDGVLSALSLAPLESYWFSGAEGAKVQGFIVRPPNFNAKKKYPVKFLIHGGPQGAWGDAWSYRWNPELMAASGYVVVMVNPRGSTGYGQAFIDGVNGDWGGKAYEDLMKGLDAAEKEFPFIDKKRECALGASYGGFMANWILTHNDRFKCIVTHDGMYNPRSAYGTTDELWFNEWEFRRPEDLKPGGKPAQPWRYEGVGMEEDPFRKWSPMLFIQDAKTPTLVIHSQNDYRLDVSEGFQLFTALQRRNIPSKMLYFPDEGHWVQKPKNSELWNKTVGDWCDEWTKTNAYAK